MHADRCKPIVFGFDVGITETYFPLLTIAFSFLLLGILDRHRNDGNCTGGKSSCQGILGVPWGNKLAEKNWLIRTATENIVLSMEIWICRQRNLSRSLTRISGTASWSSRTLSRKTCQIMTASTRLVSHWVVAPIDMCKDGASQLIIDQYNSWLLIFSRASASWRVCGVEERVFGLKTFFIFFLFFPAEQRGGPTIETGSDHPLHNNSEIHQKNLILNSSTQFPLTSLRKKKIRYFLATNKQRFLSSFDIFPCEMLMWPWTLTINGQINMPCTKCVTNLFIMPKQNVIVIFCFISQRHCLDHIFLKCWRMLKWVMYTIPIFLFDFVVVGSETHP